MNRKEFIATCGVACMGSTAMAWLQSCTANNYYAMVAKSEQKLSVKKSEFIKSENGKTSDRKYVLIKTEELNFPICIYKLNATSYTALLMECTHKSCELQPHGDYLVCPCHGSEFTKQGTVQNPPAEQDLRIFKISSDDENIYVHL